MGMFTYGIACALEPVSKAAPIILRGDMDYLAETAVKLGYEAIELQMRDPQRYDWAKLRATADQAGLKFSAIATGREYVENGLWLLSDDKAMRRAAIDKIKTHIDMGAVIGAMVIVGSMRKDIPDFSREAAWAGSTTPSWNSPTTRRRGTSCWCQRTSSPPPRTSLIPCGRLPIT